MTRELEILMQLSESMGRVEENVDSIVKHQVWQNSKLEKHDEFMHESKRSYQQNCPANKTAKKMQKAWFWAALLFALAITYFIMESLYHGTGLGEFIKNYI